MSSANRTTMIGAAVGVIGALLLVLFIVQPGPGAGAGDGPLRSVLVVADDLLPGMGPDEVRTRVRSAQLPEQFAPARRVERLEELEGFEVLRPVGPGEVLVADQFARPGPLAGGVVVPAGYEAMTIEAEPAPGVGGYVTPSARVNVYVTVDAPGDAGDGARRSFTQLVAGHVDVLAVTRGTLTGESRPVDEQASQGQIVLLLQVRPHDVPVLIHAQSQGRLWFTLVNRDDPAPQASRVAEDALHPASRSQAIAEARSRQDAARAAAERGDEQ